MSGNIIEFPGANTAEAEARSATILTTLGLSPTDAKEGDECGFQPDAVFVSDLAEAVLVGADRDFGRCRIIVGEVIKVLEAWELQAKTDRILGPRGGAGPEAA
jgi:hypothetical protein